MNLLTLLGLASLIFIVVFTLRTNQGGLAQRAALIEAWINILIGFGLNFLANFALLPLVGGHLTLASNFWLGVVYTLISLLRSYGVRRWCQDNIHKLAARAAERLT